MTVLSDPLAEVAEAQIASNIHACTELCLARRGIEQLAGFERLTNLEVLFVNDNNLTAIMHLERNFRLREIFAHNNHICSLKGSLQELKFLQKLDVSGNQLRDLPQVIKLLCGLRHLTHLNLKARPCTAANEDDNSLCVLVAELIIELYLPRSPQLRMGFHPCQHDNPCCEEPGYRLRMIHAIPTLLVLDLHVITPDERREAAQQLGRNATTGTIAFWRRSLPWDMQASRVQEWSPLERELKATVAVIRDKQLAEREAAERALYACNPSASYFANKAIPPPPGLAASNPVTWTASSTTVSSDQMGNRGKMPASAQNTGGCHEARGRYQARDVFIIHSLRPCTHLGVSGGSTRKMPSYAGDTFHGHLTLSGCVRDHRVLQL